LVLGICILLMPQPGHAIPAFARKYGVKCYACHTVPPALNKNGYMFKRLGYRMPPDEMDGTKPAPKITELDKDIKFSITNSLALILQASVTDDKTVADAGNTTSASPSTSCGSDTSQRVPPAPASTWTKPRCSWPEPIPETGFSYFGHYELYQDGTSNLEQGFGVYTRGRANSSYFIKAGEMHMQEGEGTRAAMFYNLFSDPAYTLTNVDPISFSLDQHPVGVDVGYTLGFELLQKRLCRLGQGDQRTERGWQRDTRGLYQEFQGCVGRRRLLVRSRRRRHRDDVPRVEGPDTECGRRESVHLSANLLPSQAPSATTCSSTSWTCSAATSAATMTGSGCRTGPHVALYREHLPR
jgi:hypothetical protein